MNFKTKSAVGVVKAGFKLALAATALVIAAGASAQSYRQSTKCRWCWAHPRRGARLESSKQTKCANAPRAASTSSCIQVSR